MDIDTNPLQPHPNPQPHPHHRKIELQSNADLTHLQTNLAQIAQSRLDLHFPRPDNRTKPATHISLDGLTHQPDQGQQQPKDNSTQEEHVTSSVDHDEADDPLRRNVQLLISSFLQQTWSSAQDNLSVNGMSATSIPIPPGATLSPIPRPPHSGLNTGTAAPEPAPIEEREGVHFVYAPFDTRLQHKLASLHGELETLTAQVSKLRRTAPKSGAAILETNLDNAVRAEDEAYTKSLEILQQEGEEEILHIPTVRTGWNEDVTRNYETGLRELARLAGMKSEHDESVGASLTETVGKAQRARTVALEME